MQAETAIPFIGDLVNALSIVESKRNVAYDEDERIADQIYLDYIIAHCTEQGIDIEKLKRDARLANREN